MDKPKSYVYLIKAAPETYKIGYSVDPERRLRTIARHKDFPLSIEGLIPAPNGDGQSLEWHIHIRLGHKKIALEWFRLTEAEVDQLLETYGGWRYDRTTN